MQMIQENTDNAFAGIYRGKVLDVEDPLKLGRIKIQVYPAFYRLEKKFIPWATPAFSLFAGAGEDTGSFCVPDVDSFVFVFFECGRYSQPVYFAEAQTAQKGIPIESQSNYPSRKVWKTRQGLTVYIDESNNELSINHPSGTKIEIDSTGKVLIDSSSIELGSSLGKSKVLTTNSVITAPSGGGACVVTLPANHVKAS
jgi:hypothetical protein